MVEGSEMRPLGSYKMLDLSRYLPGPYCSMILADLGMEVLKVEEPYKGDPARWVGPRRRKDSVYFLAANRNKRSIGINLVTEEGKEIFLRLCTKYDIILENFAPGTMDRLGLSYKVLSRIKPSLIFCSITGFGQEGPYRDKPGHDINYLGLAGILNLNCDEKGHPVVPGVLISDLTSGLFASIGILAALAKRNLTGKGSYIDISMMDGLLSLLGYRIAQYGLDQSPSGKGKTEFDGWFPCYNLYETSDGQFITLGAMEFSFWKNFCYLIGQPEWVDKQWVNDPDSKEIAAQLRKVFRTRSKKEWEEYFKDQEVCCDPVRGVEELLSDPQVMERRMIIEMEHPHEGKIFQAGNPIKLSEIEEVFEPPPQLNQHTEEVLRDLGYHPSMISHFREKRVI